MLREVSFELVTRLLRDTYCLCTRFQGRTMARSPLDIMFRIDSSVPETSFCTDLVQLASLAGLSSVQLVQPI